MVRNTHDFVDDHHDIDGLVTALAAEGLVSGVTVQDEGSPLTGLGTTLNFAGAGVVATGSGDTKTITISGGGGGGGVDVEDDGTPLATTATTLNFTGTGVTASGSGTTKTINIPGGGGFGVGRDTSVIQNECYYDSSLTTYDGMIEPTVSGTGAVVGTPSAVETGHPGIIRCFTGTATTGRASLTTAADRRTGDAQISFGCIVKLPILSDGTQTYTAQMGLTLSTSTVDSDEVVAFRYTNGSLSGNWGGSTRHFAVGTNLEDLGVAADTDWHCFEFVLSEDCSTVSWTIDGSSVGSSSSGIPPAGTDIRVTPCMINKSAGTTGRELLIDAYWYHYEFSTPR